LLLRDLLDPPREDRKAIDWSRMRGSDDRAEIKNLFTKPEALLPQLEALVDRQAYQNLRHGGIVRFAFQSCFYTQFDELLASPLLAVLLFGLLRMRVTN
jgi:hypothetical protein